MNTKTRNIAIGALFFALTFVVTRFVQIPIPLGYFNVGNSIILIGCTILPLPFGVFVGSFASALADLTSYPAYTIPTLIIKALMPLAFYGSLKFPIKKAYVKNVFAFSIATLIPLFGYTLTGAILYKSFITGLTQFPGLLLEYLANIVIFAITLKPITSLSNKYLQ